MRQQFRELLELQARYNALLSGQMEALEYVPEYARRPLTRRIETYPLGDLLYDRSKARDDLIRANMDWIWYKGSLSAANRDDIEKVERIFRKTERRNVLT